MRKILVRNDSREKSLSSKLEVDGGVMDAAKGKNRDRKTIRGLDSKVSAFLSFT